MAFSDNFDAIKGYATTAAEYAAKTTKKLASIAKANISILSEEDKIKKAQIELGKVYYKDFILGEEPDQAEYLPWCEKITESLKLIDSLKEDIEKARQVGDTASCCCDTEEAADAETEPAPEEAPADRELPEIVIVEEPEEAPAEEAPAEEAPAEEAPEEDAHDEPIEE